LDVYLTGSTKINSRLTFHNSAMLPGYASLAIKRYSRSISFIHPITVNPKILFFIQTGKSKHYGFIEFDSSSVAQIVAETMDNYLIMGHILRCKLIPKDQVHPELWVGANRKWRAVPRGRLTRVEHNKVSKALLNTCSRPQLVVQQRTESEQMRTNKRLLKRQNERKRKLEQAGIKYDFEAVSYVRIYWFSLYLFKS
jgi:RNA recognition motif-containing protein